MRKRLKWEENYKLALAYYKENGNSEIPYNFKTIDGINYDKDGFWLGSWISNQRRNYNKLNEEQKEKLKLIEIQLENIRRSLKWDEWYKLSLSYFNHNGNSEIPYDFKTIDGINCAKNGFKLGAWIENQRMNYEKLTEEQKEKLKLIKFRFENIRRALKWDEWYELSLSYFNHNGNSEIPRNFKTIDGINCDENGLDLGRWINDQRIEKDKLTSYQIEKLELIKFRWNLDNKFTTYSYKKIK